MTSCLNIVNVQECIHLYPQKHVVLRITDNFSKQLDHVQLHIVLKSTTNVTSSKYQLVKKCIRFGV